jgi:hypothetical protein
MAHRSGYTGFSVRLDNATLKYGSEPEATNVIAVHVDPTFGSEWWCATVTTAIPNWSQRCP